MISVNTTTVAAIDLGSNSFHLIIARVSEDHFQIIDNMREMVRLAAGLDDDNNLDQDSRQRALDCLSRFGQRLQNIPEESVRIVGTNTLRKASNSREFLKEAEAAVGYPIEIIAGVEEARMIYLGVSHSRPNSSKKSLVVDIGGGSTEIIVGQHFEPQRMESLYMGCVSFSKRYFADGEITPQKIESARMAAHLELQPHAVKYSRGKWSQAVGASGTIKSIREIVQANGWSESGISYAGLIKLVQAFRACGSIDNLKIAGLKSERKAVIVGGAVVLLAIFEALDIEVMAVSDWALREGVIYDMLGRDEQENVRARTISSLLQRYHIDREQAERVVHSSKEIFKQVKEPWELSKKRLKSLLEWASLLHEIGLDIAHSQYHRHGSYLLENSDLPGFSRQEQQQLAFLVLSHRRKIPIQLLKQCRKSEQLFMSRLIVVLRLSILIHRSHHQSDCHLDVVVNNDEVNLRFTKGWLDEHPLTRADLEQESKYLVAAGFVLNFS
ncbi:MAG TPA: exopolyphosphatase [Ectothiorhodospiraceae bacterium]|nr:exopolyphosphatase [Ectothiorhodospiraceae bacterium]